MNELPDQGRNRESGLKTLDDLLYIREVKMYSKSFELQGNLAVIFAYVKLKEMEIRNIVWLAEMITRQIGKNDKSWNKIIVPFHNETD